MTVSIQLGLEDGRVTLIRGGEISVGEMKEKPPGKQMQQTLVRIHVVMDEALHTNDHCVAQNGLGSAVNSKGSDSLKDQSRDMVHPQQVVIHRVTWSSRDWTEK